VLITAAEAQFGPDYRAVHMVNTERLAGSADYGECTVRDSARTESFRSPLHAFHVDKYLPSLAKTFATEGVKLDASGFVDAHWQYWQADFEMVGLNKRDIVRCLEENTHSLVNIWVSLTPGIIEQQPLVFMDRQRAILRGCDPLEKVVSIQNVSPQLKDSTNHFLPSCTAQNGLFHWRPQMRFGEAFIFSTLHTPHSAVWLSEQSPCSARCSGELRLFMVETPSSFEFVSCPAPLMLS
jgi:hypothetical protein